MFPSVMHCMASILKHELSESGRVTLGLDADRSDKETQSGGGRDKFEESLLFGEINSPLQARFSG